MRGGRCIPHLNRCFPNDLFPSHFVRPFIISGLVMYSTFSFSFSLLSFRLTTPCFTLLPSVRPVPKVTPRPGTLFAS